MSIDTLWTKSLHKAVYAHFLSMDVGLPWETDRELNGDKISISLPVVAFKQNGSAQYKATFKIRLVCTCGGSGLYDLAEKAGPVASTLVLPIVMFDSCALAGSKEVQINYFDWNHGYRQASMENDFSVDIRG